MTYRPARRRSNVSKSGLNISVARGSIRTIACAVPAFSRSNDLIPNASKAAQVTGVMARRHGPNSGAFLCFAAARRAIAATQWPLNSIDTLVMVTQTPERLIPGQGYDVHAWLGLPASCRVIDVNAGCAGYVQGLWLAMRSLDYGERALLLVGDTLSHVCDPSDRATAPLFGDAGSATAIEGTGEAHRFFFGTDGTGNDALSQSGHSTLRMKGADVFAFTLRTVPGLVEDVLAAAVVFPGGRPDYLLFHQANAFMLNHFAAMPILQEFKPEQIPRNVAEFGNCSSASIPLLVCDKLGPLLDKAPLSVAMFGYGAGWQWAGVNLGLGPGVSCPLVEV
jgi:3-oxoacyl-[acyl-carrier-protein] synthase-3